MNSRVVPGSKEKVNFFFDLFVLLAAVPTATLLSGRAVTPNSPELMWLTISAMGVWIFTAIALRHYDPWANRTVLDDAAMVSIIVLAVATMLSVVNIFAPASAAVPKVAYFLLLVWPLTVLMRLVWAHLLSPKDEEPLGEVLVVGTGPLGRVTAEDLERSRARRQKVLGFLSFPEDKKPERLGDRYLGPASEIATFLANTPVHEVYVAGNSVRDHDSMQLVIKACETFGIPFALPPAYGFRFDRARLSDPKAVLDGYLHYTNFAPKPSQMALKRLIDIVVSAVALWCLLPLLFAVAALIRLTSKGPIFFKQVRVGLNGRQFHMLKFRSMVVNAEALKATLESRNEQSGPVFKMKNDPRVTAVGRFIRRYSIDELPQLINVLRGDMSLVGPRPPVPKEVVQYKPWQRRRLSVRPGLTCIWQVSGRNQISFEEWMYMDMQYIDHWSLSEDFNLILKTFPAVFTGRGAS